VRKRILEILGVCGLPDLPTHDQNDACVSALLAAAADGRVPGVTLLAIGSPLFADTNGTLREGPMVIPKVTTETDVLIAQACATCPSVQRVGSPAAGSALRTRHDFHAYGSSSVPTSANEFLEELIANALRGHPQVYTYSAAYRRLFNCHRGKPLVRPVRLEEV
jgi:hypothetical protein